MHNPKTWSDRSKWVYQSTGTDKVDKQAEESVKQLTKSKQLGRGKIHNRVSQTQEQTQTGSKFADLEVVQESGLCEEVGLTGRKSA